MKHPDTVIHISSEEMRELAEFVRTHPASGYWLISNGCAIGTTLKVRTGKGKENERDITDYEAW